MFSVRVWQLLGQTLWPWQPKDAAQEEQDGPHGGTSAWQGLPQLGTALKGPEVMPRAPIQGSRVADSARGSPRAPAEMKWHPGASPGETGLRN